MKMPLVVLVVIVAILGCALGYEIVQKKRAVAQLQEEWLKSAVSDSLRAYEQLDRGDVAKVKEHLMLIANVSAKGYEYSHGREPGTKFDKDIAEAYAILDEYQATNKLSQ